MLLLAIFASVATGAAVGFMLSGGSKSLVYALAEKTVKPEQKYHEWADALGLDWDDERIRQEVRRDLRYLLLAFLGSIALLPFISLGQVLILAAVAMVTAYHLPKWLLRRKAERKWVRFEETLPDALMVMVQSMRAGDALIQSIRRAAQRVPGPIQEEFDLIYREYSIRGLSTEEVLNRARKRIPTEGFKMVSSALILGTRHGGDLLDVLQRLSESIRALTGLRRKLYIETAEVRMQETIAIWITPAFGLLVCLFEPDNFALLFSTFRGNIILLTVVALQVFGVMTIRAILRATM